MSVIRAARDLTNPRARARTSRPGVLVLAAALAALAAQGTPAGADTGDPVPVPDVLTGGTWLQHHSEDLLPYWDQPAALGDPVGDFPSFRGRNGELISESAQPRVLSTLARQVYGYSLSFMLTGRDRYLTYAKAGLDWIDAHAKDPVYGGYYGDLNADGLPVDADGKVDFQQNKDLFDLASLGLAYGMYYNVTRDPVAEDELLGVRDLIFDKYYDAAEHRMKDSLTYDLSTEVDTGGNGGNGEDITDILVPATAVILPNVALLSDPARQAQFKDDLRELVQILIARHKNSQANNANNRFWFWGRSERFGNFNAPETDFGHNLLSYAVIYNADNLLPDRPWDSLSADRDRLLSRAWDDAASRWNQQIVRSFGAGNVEPDSSWWIHDEADQLLATLDLYEGFTHTDQLARSAQTFLDVYVDRDPAYPARETFGRIERTGTSTELRKSFYGKNMLHNFEHALILYLHGQALEGKPATLYYAFPADQALTAVAEPYWFTAAGQTRTVTRDLTTLPGRKVVEVAFTGIGQAAREPYPTPGDITPPVTTASVSPDANPAGWDNEPVTVDLSATDDLVGVKEIHVLLDDQAGLTPDRAVIEAGNHATVTLDSDGVYDVSYYAVDLVGNREPVRTVQIRVDRTPPTVSGLPTEPCLIWPPNGRMVTVAHVAGTDALSGVADVKAEVTADEPAAGDVIVDGGTVSVRAFRDDDGDGRDYTVTGTVTDAAGNVAVRQGVCTVPHDKGHHDQSDRERRRMRDSNPRGLLTQPAFQASAIGH